MFPAKCARRVLFVFALLSFLGSAAALTLIFTLFCRDCAVPNSLLKLINGVAAVTLYVIGIITLFIVIFHKGLQSTSSVISEIPAEDLEKSPAPTLPYNHIPHHPAFGEVYSRDLPDYFTAAQNSNEVETSLRDLPDYFSAVQNVDGVYSSVGVGFSTENVPKTPPPCYEKSA